jgi:hypothetical protein
MKFLIIEFSSIEELEFKRIKVNQIAEIIKLVNKIL